MAALAVDGVLGAEQGDTVADHELRNLATVARAMVDAALRRTESRGAHTRDDHPALDPALGLRLVYV